MEMPSGKLASQAGHAFLESFESCRNQDPVRAAEYKRDGIGTKVVLAAKTESELLVVKEKADQRGIPWALIVDSGHIMEPHFDGNPIVTALGLGPARREEIKDLTKKFQLYI